MSADAFPATLAESLVRALGNMTNVARGDEAKIPGKEGKPGYSYRYADLGDLLTAVRPILAAQGLAISQGCTNDGRSVSVSTTLLHWSGASMVSDPLSLPGAGTPQAVGSAITYARRYQLMAVLGLASDDDDGQQAAASPYVESVVEAPRVDDPERLAAVQVFDAIRALPAEAMDQFRAWLNGRSVSVPTLTGDVDWRDQVSTKVVDLQLAGDQLSLAEMS